MLCFHSDISNKPNLIVDNLSASTSHTSDFELDSFVVKPVIVDTTCLDNSENSCLNSCVKTKSKDTGTQAHGKFVPTCHNCGKIGHIRPNCYLLKSHGSWIKQDAMRKSEIEDSSSSKYVPFHRRHIKGKVNVICKNANHNFAENVKKHSNKKNPAYLSSLRHHRSHLTQMSISLGSEVEGLEGAVSKSYIKHSTYNGTSGSMASAAACSCQSE
jgi:hypothetical protein